MAEVKFSVTVTVEDGKFCASVEGQEVHTWATSMDDLVDNVVEALRLHLDDDDSVFDLEFKHPAYVFLHHRSVKAV